MNVEKRKRYSDAIDIVGVHTISGYTHQDVYEIDTRVKQTIKSCSHKKNRNDDGYRTYLQINPNKINGNQKIITSYVKFESVLGAILEKCKLDSQYFKITRADMCFDSTDLAAYKEYQKLHRLLICCVAETYKVENCYMSYDLWSYKPLSVAIKNSSFEIENYDKEKESAGSSEAKNRLELRSKKIKSAHLRSVFQISWCRRLQKSIKNFGAVQQHYNNELERIYKEDLKEPIENREYLNLTSFLMRYKDCIFTRNQMIDLLSRFEEVESPISRADNFKKKHSIEYFSMRDLQVVVQCLEEKIDRYFNGWIGSKMTKSTKTKNS